MPKRSLVWKLFPVLFAIAALSMLVISMLAVSMFGEFYYRQVGDDLKTRARLMSRQLADNTELREDPRRLESFAKSADQCCDTRVTVIAPDGQVLADSRDVPRNMENHSDRPEFRTALKGRVGSSRRKSPSLGISMVYAAAPVKIDDRVVMVVRTSLVADAVDAAVSLAYARFAAAALAIAVLAGLASLLAAKQISKPIRRIQQAAQRFADGDLQARAPMPDTEELASLAQTLDAAASQIVEQLRTITHQAREQQAIVSSMKEGVIAVDTQDRVILLNPAAEELLGVALDSARDRVIQEVVRNPGLQSFFQTLRESGEPSLQEITFHGVEDRVVQAAGAPLVGGDERRAGVVVVLNDITQNRKLENVRKDFVANVSHELKTPITAIKGYVETLQHGAIDDPKTAGRFLETIHRQADRLNAIVDDLLALSRIEQSADAKEIELTRTSICAVLESARMNCLTSAEDERISIDIVDGCDEHLSARINAPLLEQAVTNLLDNAIKYSHKDATVVISSEAVGDEIAIRVVDHGEGIEPEDLPRIFERFYRADKARSREKGGTGLGLAIVKHIVQAHGGRTTVESTPGEGSTFTIFLPAA